MFNNYEEYVRGIFQQKFQIILKKIPESNTKSADFDCFHNGKKIAICELKTFIYEKPSAETGWKKDENEFWYRNDNAVNRVAKKIYEAYKQLEKSNLPKILILLNDTSKLDVNDFYEAFNGYQIFCNEEAKLIYKHTASKKIAYGRLKKVKELIDLYIWTDTNKLSDKLNFHFGNDMGSALFEKYFN